MTYTRHQGLQWGLQNEYDMVSAALGSAYSLVGETEFQIQTVNVLHLLIAMLETWKGSCIRDIEEGHLSQLGIHRDGLVRALGCYQKGALSKDTNYLPQSSGELEKQIKARLANNTPEF